MTIQAGHSRDVPLRAQAAPADGRRRADFDRAQRHSRRVDRLKILLPGLAVAAVAGFFAWSYLSIPGIEGVSVEGTAISDGKLVMANPKLDGFTRDNLPYSMTALRAVQDLGNTSVIRLEEIDAKLPVSATNSAKVVAETGTYDNTRNTLVLDSKVTVTTSDGMIARLQSASVDIGTGQLTSDLPVEIIMERSRIEADSMVVSDNGKVISFERRVRVDFAPPRPSDNTRTGTVDAPQN